MLPKIFSWQQSDTEFITNIQTMVTFWDRYRGYVAVAIVATLCWIFWYIHATYQLLASLDAGGAPTLENLNRFYLLIALVLGMTIGLNLAGLLYYLVKSTLGGYRTERILLRLNADLEQYRDKSNF